MPEYTTLAEFEAIYPFATREEALAFIRKESMRDMEPYGVRAFDTDRYGVRPKPPHSKRGKRLNITRKELVRDMLLNGTTVDKISDALSCTVAAASSLISDVRRMGYTINRNENFYKIISD